jgi:hypothetical protein
MLPAIYNYIIAVIDTIKRQKNMFKSQKPLAPNNNPKCRRKNTRLAMKLQAGGQVIRTKKRTSLTSLILRAQRVPKKVTTKPISPTASQKPYNIIALSQTQRKE